MSDPSSPEWLEHLASRPFAFYPPIVGVEHNEWRMRRATWSEILVANTRDNIEVWIPRRYFGEISRVDQPVMIVGLTRELEYKAGAVWPYERRVISMPPPPGPLRYPPEQEREPPPPIHPPRATSTESRIGRLIAAVLGGGLLAFIVIVTVFRIGPMRSRVVFTARDQAYLELTRLDDYHTVVKKLGPPEEERWRSAEGEIQYQRLTYSQRGYSVILMGPNRNQARYIGTVDRNWQVLHYVELPGGGDTAAILRSLKRF
ncbi:MAG: hypothetical protein ACP5U2_02620 [Bryobacteraceae bacterium]